MLKFSWGYKVSFIVIKIILCLLIFNEHNSFAHVPHDVIGAIEISPNYHRDKIVFVVVPNLGQAGDMLLKSSDGGFSWKELIRGIDSTAELSCIAISPSFKLDKTLFVSSNGDGVYRSRDGGSSWLKANNGLDNLSIGMVAISPEFHSDKTILAAGTEGGLYKSQNGGGSWYQVMGSSNKVTAIAFSSGQKKDYALAGNDKGLLYLSTDSGEIWQQRFQIPNCGSILSIAVSPTVSPHRTYFIGTEKRGLFKVVDSGVTQVRLNNGLSLHSLAIKRSEHSAECITSLAISSSYETDSTIFACTWHEAIFCSRDRGRTWKKYSTGITTTRQADEFKSPHFKNLRLSNTFEKDKLLFLGGFDGLFRSTDGGTVWEQMETLSSKSILSLALSFGNSPDPVIAMTTYDGGAYMTSDQGITWEVRNKGLKHTHLEDIAFSPNFLLDNTMFTISNHALYKSTNSGKDWDRIEPGSGKSFLRLIASKLLRRVFDKPQTARERGALFAWVIAVSPGFAYDKTVYCGTRYRGVFRSADSGENWSPIWKAKEGVEGWIKSLVVSPNFSVDRTLYAGVRSQGIYKTEDGGRTWQYVNKSLTPLLLEISPNYENDNTVFASAIEGLFKTQNGGQNWEKLEILPNSDNYYPGALAISPNYRADKTLIVSLKGRGLFKSTDGGVTFAQTGHDLINENRSIRILRFSPTDSFNNSIYAASREELFHSKDGGNTWKVIKRPVRYENRKKDVIRYQGEWKLLNGNDFSATSVTHSDIAHSKAILPFVGSGVTWIGTASNNQGIAKVYVDGNLKDCVDQFSHTRDVMVKSYSVTGLGYGPHTIMIEVTGTKNTDSTGNRIEIDAFDILP